jgi:hypothetical protein
MARQRTNNLVTRGARFGYTPRFSDGERFNEADAPQRVATENAGATCWPTGTWAGFA